MPHRAIETDRAPKAIGPYSQAIIDGEMVYCSGQIPINPSTGQIESQDIEGQAFQALTNVLAVLLASGSGPEHVLSVTVYLIDFDEFAVVNRVYGNFFPKPYPARATVEVGRLPMGARIEVSAIAKLKPSFSGDLKLS